MSALVLKRGEWDLDHVAFATADTQAGAGWFAAQTGVQPVITEPEPGQWYHSAAVPLHGGGFIEILGPNPAHRGFHPLKSLLTQYQTPSPLFWYIATEDFDGLQRLAGRAGAPVGKIEHVENETPHGRRSYTRGVLGPGFRSVQPCVIEWQERPERPELAGEPQIALKEFALNSPDSARLNQVFETLGLSQHSGEGLQEMRLVLETPKGEVAFSGPGLEMAGWSAFKLMAKSVLLHLRGAGRGQAGADGAAQPAD